VKRTRTSKLANMLGTPKKDARVSTRAILLRCFFASLLLKKKRRPVLAERLFASTFVYYLGICTVPLVDVA